ncbi:MULTISPECIES: hypothetical protein [unclassified Kribbella]|uniref:hypothetical protein n=1 Tax=unclassified Kribbella TaxID=2644121 RepID=UPI003076A376
MDNLLGPGAFLAFMAAVIWYAQILTRAKRDQDAAEPLRDWRTAPPALDLGKTGNAVSFMWVTGFCLVLAGLLIGSLFGRPTAGVATGCVVTVATWLVAAIWLLTHRRPS